VWRPLHTEFGFGFGPGAGRDAASRPDPIALDGGWLLHGVVDLIERDTSGRTLRVTDHKTGANRTNEDIVVGNGEVLQPVLYGLAVEAALSTPVAESRLFFCTARGGFTERVVKLGQAERRAGAEVLQIVDRAVELGMLAPAPRVGLCAWCDFRDVCGPYEEGRIQRKDPTPLQDLLQLRTMP
jgi:CRISPR/Cas system-associated exonuclease Cas4 (RecB family)